MDFDVQIILDEMVDTELAYLDENYYADLLEKKIDELERKFCAFVPCVNLDNEAGPNAGLDQIIRPGR